jgi:hypothetical protein
MQSSFEADGLYDLQQDQSEHRAMTTAEASYTPEICANCLHLKNRSRKLSNSVKTLRAAAKKRRAEIRKLRKKGIFTDIILQICKLALTLSFL